jgi:hypothetical protein
VRPVFVRSRGADQKIASRPTARIPQNPEALEHEIGMLLFRVKTGQPKSEGLMKILEDPENLKLMNRAELELHKDQKKVDLYREKEELLFAIDEKGFEADLTEKGPQFHQPERPGGLCAARTHHGAARN